MDQKEANSDRNEQELADRHHNTFDSFQPFCNFHKLCSENPESPYHLDGKWKQPEINTCYWINFVQTEMGLAFVVRTCSNNSS